MEPGQQVEVLVHHGFLLFFCGAAAEVSAAQTGIWTVQCRGAV
jgi:hypothetical protein